MLKKANKILPFIGLGILAYLIYKSGPQIILNTVFEMNLAFLPISAVLFLLYLFLQTYKWGYLVRKQGIDIDFLSLFKIYLIGSFYGIITPGRVGNFIRIKYLKTRTGRKSGECSVSIVIDKVLDFMALFALTSIGMLLLANYISYKIFLAVLFIFLSFFAALLIFMKKKTSRVILKAVWRILPGGLKGKAREAFNTFYENMIEWKGFIMPFFITLLGWVLMYSSTYMIALSLDMNIPYFSFITILPVATLISLIPITVGGWGTREAALVVLLSIFGAQSNTVIVMSITASLIGYIITSVLGATFAFSEEFKAVR